MQINRLFEMVYLLLNKKSVTAGELAAHFEVSPRTIYRDVELLSSAGIPIYMTKGKGGGISLLPDFVLNKTVLTAEETGCEGSGWLAWPPAAQPAREAAAIAADKRTERIRFIAYAPFLIELPRESLFSVQSSHRKADLSGTCMGTEKIPAPHHPGSAPESSARSKELHPRCA